MKKKKFYLLIAIFCGWLIPGLSVEATMAGQSILISGIVVDGEGRTMPGVTIVVQGTTQGTTTDLDGKFTLPVPNENSVLVVSFVGYTTQTIIVGNQRTLDIRLQESQIALREVVVVGYGIQKKVSVTGAISSVKTDELLKSSSTSIANAMAGHISGLSSTQSSGGQPGVDNATMYLRGAGTLNTTSPLILIDGVPRDNIRTIDPNEVESISVLKDASATAVFGVRGANGVILITTKRGKEGSAQLSLNATQSFSSLTREPSRLHSVDYLRIRNEALHNDGLDGAMFSQDVIDLYANPLLGLNPDDPDYQQKAAVRQYMYPDHDYYREFIRQYAPQTVVNANMSGGTKQLSYFLNAGYVHQGGVLNTLPESELGYDPSSKLDRWSFRANLDYKIAPTLKAFLNVGTYIENVNMPSVHIYGDDNTGGMMRDLFYQAQTILPISPGPVTIAGFGAEPGRLVEPSFLNAATYLDRSAYEIMNYLGFRRETKSNLNSTLGMEWDLSNLVTPGLSVKGMFSYDSYARTVLQGAQTVKLYQAKVDYETDQLSYSTYRENANQLSISKYARSQYKINAQLSLIYNRKFAEKHDVGGMVLTQRDYWESEAGELPYNMISVAGRATYNYDNRYFGEVNLGYNGSEQFAPGRRFGFFPAASVGWAISNENFLINNKILTYLKLRVSYGRVGNDKMMTANGIPLRFMYIDQTSMGAGYLGSLGQGNGVTEGLYGNPNLTWETADKFNIGFDFQIIKDITGTIDFYTENRSDILITRGTISAFQGIPLGNIPKANMGRLKNKGMDIELTYSKQLTENLHITVKGNLGLNRNTLKDVDESPMDGSYKYRYRSTGYSIGQNFGYLIDWDKGGYWTKEQLANTSLKCDFGQPRPGDFIYVDMNSDGKISEADQVPIGDGQVPRRTYGFSLNVDYKGFDMTVFFQGVGGYARYYTDQGVLESTRQGTYFDYQRTSWTQERWDNGGKITYPALSTGRTTNHQPNTFFIQDRSFLRFKNFELGYTLPEKSLKAIGISKMRIFVNGQNLFVWDKLRTTHLDPEYDDPIGYPLSRILSFGANVTF